MYLSELWVHLLWAGAWSGRHSPPNSFNPHRLSFYLYCIVEKTWEVFHFNRCNVCSIIEQFAQPLVSICAIVFWNVPINKISTKSVEIVVLTTTSYNILLQGQIHQLFLFLQPDNRLRLATRHNSWESLRITSPDYRMSVWYAKIQWPHHTSLVPISRKLR